MKIILSRDEKIELLQAIKLGIPVLTDEDIQKIIEINNELKKKKSI